MGAPRSPWTIIPDRPNLPVAGAAPQGAARFNWGKIMRYVARDETGAIIAVFAEPNEGCPSSE